jgi:hypothetical protein
MIGAEPIECAYAWMRRNRRLARDNERGARYIFPAAGYFLMMRFEPLS